METASVVLAQHGDPAAFERLADSLVDTWHRIAYSVLGDSHLAEDATQQALVAVWRDLPRLRDPARFEGWAYRLLVRACYREARRTPRWLPSLFDAGQEPLGSTDAIGAIVDRDQLERGFRRLSVEHRTVIVLHHYQDLPLDEVALILGVPRGTVRSRLHRAMQTLRAALEADARPVPEARVHEQVMP